MTLQNANRSFNMLIFLAASVPFTSKLSLFSANKLKHHTQKPNIVVNTKHENN